MIYVAATADVDEYSITKDNVRVEGHAVVKISKLSGDSVIKDKATVVEVSASGAAQIYGNTIFKYSDIKDAAKVYGSSKVYEVNLKDEAQIYGNATVTYSSVSGSSQIFDNAILDNCEIAGDVKFYGNAHLSGIKILGNIHVFGNAKLVNQMVTGDRIILKGNCKFGGNATFENLYRMKDFIKKYGSNKVDMVGRDVQLTDVWDMG